MLDVPAVGDTSEAVTATPALTGPDGTNLTVTSLLAVAVDGDRLMFLQQSGPTSTPPDPAAFRACRRAAVPGGSRAPQPGGWAAAQKSRTTTSLVVPHW